RGGTGRAAELTPSWRSVVETPAQKSRITGTPDGSGPGFKFAYPPSTPVLTPPRAQLTLNFHLAAGKAGKAVRIGRGPATVIGSSSRKPGHPPLAQRPRALREKGRGRKPLGRLAGLFSFGRISRRNRRELL